MRKFCSTIVILLFLAFGFASMDISAQNRDEVVVTDFLPETKIWVVENRLVIENLPQDAVLDVYSIVGMKVFSQKVKAGTNEYVLNLPKGYYIVKVGTIVKKIALR